MYFGRYIDLVLDYTVRGQVNAAEEPEICYNQNTHSISILLQY